MKRIIYTFLFILGISQTSIYACQDSSIFLDSLENERKWSLGYMGAFYYDQSGFLLFPLGLMAEYKLNRRESIDIQGVNYYFGKDESNSLFIYNFSNWNFTQIDIGYNLYFRGDRRKNEGPYFRTSLGTFLFYEHSILHLKDENLGIDIKRLTTKAFVGIQFGTRNRFTERFYYRLSAGSTFSFFYDDFNLSINSNKTILISPYIALGIGMEL